MTKEKPANQEAGNYSVVSNQVKVIYLHQGPSKLIRLKLFIVSVKKPFLHADVLGKK